MIPSLSVFSQDSSNYIHIGDFLEGIYKTKEDFLAKKPSHLDSIFQLKKIDWIEEYSDIPPDSVFDEGHFHYRKNREIVKNVFAIKYKGELYIQQKSIIENLRENDEFQEGISGPFLFYRVLGDGRFLYLKGNYTTGISKAISYIRRDFILLNKDFTNRYLFYCPSESKFEIITTCKDLKNFISDFKLNIGLDCKNKNTRMYLKVQDFLNPLLH